MSKTEITLVCWDKRGGRLGPLVVELGDSVTLLDGTDKVELLAITERRTV